MHDSRSAKELKGWRFLKGLTELAGELLFLERCRICQTECKSLIEQAGSTKFSTRAVCAECWRHITKNDPVLDWDAASRSFRIASGVWYRGPLKRLVYQLKYDGDRLLAYDLSHLLVSAWSLVADEACRSTVVFVPIPLHPERLRTRGFNQSELLARAAGKRLGIPVDSNSLRRVKPTVEQHGLRRDERVFNLKDAFACARSSVRGKSAVLIDDVCTSGATLSEAARVVLDSGASGVYGLTVARAMLACVHEEVLE